MPPERDDAMLQDHERRVIRLETEMTMVKTDMQRVKDELAVYQASAISADKKMTQVLVTLVGDKDMQVKGLMQRIEGIEAVTDMVKELKWKFAGALVVVGWAMAFAYWCLQHIFK